MPHKEMFALVKLISVISLVNIKNPGPGIRGPVWNLGFDF